MLLYEGIQICSERKTEASTATSSELGQSAPPAAGHGGAKKAASTPASFPGILPASGLMSSHGHSLSGMLCQHHPDHFITSTIRHHPFGRINAINPIWLDADMSTVRSLSSIQRPVNVSRKAFWESWRTVPPPPPSTPGLSPQSSLLSPPPAPPAPSPHQPVLRSSKPLPPTLCWTEGESHPRPQDLHRPSPCLQSAPDLSRPGQSGQEVGLQVPHTSQPLHPQHLGTIRQE